MSNRTTLTRLEDIMVDQLGIARTDIKPESNIYDDLGADSLDQVELIMAIEEEWDIEIPEEEGDKLKTVQLLVDYIDKATTE
jgi:acyl carrier protein